MRIFFYANFMESKETKMPANIYPQISARLIANPNRLYAFFVLGFVIKTIMLIPQFFELIFLGIAAFVMVVLINPFVVLFTGKYWDSAYQLTSGILRLTTKISFFLYGLTDKYPGFGFAINDNFSVDIPKPQAPNRFFAIPVLGGLARIILLIPFLIYENVIRNAGYIAMVVSSFPVLFKGNYPESTYEIERDSVRLNLSMSMYMVGLSDKYPSFWISMNHQTVKIILIILGVLMMFGNGFNSTMQPKSSYDYSMPSQQNNTNSSETGY